MLLLDYGNSAATAGDDDLVSFCQSADCFDLYNVNGLGSGNDAAEALARLFIYLISFFGFNLSIFCGHISADELGGFIKSFVIGINGYLCKNGGNRFADPAA